MTATKARPKSLRLSGGRLDDNSEQIAKELQRMLVTSTDDAAWRVAPQADQVLRENVRAGRVQCIPHFVRLLRWTGNGARIAALLRTLFTPPVTTETPVELAHEDTVAQCDLDPLEMDWATGKITEPAELFEFIEKCERNKEAIDRMQQRAEQQVFSIIGMNPAVKPITRAVA